MLGEPRCSQRGQTANDRPRECSEAREVRRVHSPDTPPLACGSGQPAATRLTVRPIMEILATSASWPARAQHALPRIYRALSGLGHRILRTRVTPVTLNDVFFLELTGKA